MGGEVNFMKFEDVDRFREVLRGWDTEPTQLAKGKLTIRWDQIDFDDLAISRLQTDRKISEHSAYQAGRVCFVVCLSSKIFCGMHVPTGSLVVFGPGREYRNVLGNRWGSFEILMSSELFRLMEYAESVSRRIALGPERSVMPLSPKLAATFRDWSANFLAPFRSERSLTADPYWSGAVRERTLTLLHEAMYENGNVGIGMHPIRHIHGWTLVARALECIDRRGHDRLSVHNISNEMECTTRALQSAFRSALGVTPLQYVLARRLHLARREILSIHNGAPSVTKAAADSGFMHFGRFSQYYQCLFGELPSSTVQRARAIRPTK
jgi:AraC family transcriptional regulator, ethanolamine operon transcriptional activator